MGDDLISRAALEAKLKAFYGVQDGKMLCTAAIGALAALADAPAVDAVQVVRCRDCLCAMKLPENRAPYFADDAMLCAMGRGTENHGACVVMPDDFCSDGILAEEMEK